MELLEKVEKIREKTGVSYEEAKAALEALAVVAYRQPVTKGYIEKVRGGDCSGIVNTLISRNLIEECGRLDAPGKPILYRTTPDFLRCFGLSSVSELEPEDENGPVQMEINEVINEEERKDGKKDQCGACRLRRLRKIVPRALYLG